MPNTIRQEAQVRWSVICSSIGNPMNFVEQSKAMDCFLMLVQRGEQAELVRTTFTKSTELVATSSEFDFAEDKR